MLKAQGKYFEAGTPLGGPNEVDAIAKYRLSEIEEVARPTFHAMLENVSEGIFNDSLCRFREECSKL